MNLAEPSKSRVSQPNSPTQTTLRQQLLLVGRVFIIRTPW